MVRFSAIRGVTVIGLFGLVIAGCATAGSTGTVKAVTPADMRWLAGVWQGTMTGMGGGSVPATLTVEADGGYTVRGGAYASQGKAEVKDGKLEFVTTQTSGVGAIGERTGSAVLMDRGDTWGLVGSGRAPAGPFNFDVSKVK
jgi:hypothetical protein